MQIRCSREFCMLGIGAVWPQASFLPSLSKAGVTMPVPQGCGELSQRVQVNS